MKQFIFYVLVMSNFISFSGVVTGSVVSQSDQVIISRLGETVTVKCMTLKDKDRYLLWYQQRLGQMLQIMCMSHTHTDAHYVGEFNDSHISCQRTEGGFDLKIRNSNRSDEASYYCAGRNRFELLDFGNGTFLRVWGNFQVEIILLVIFRIKFQVNDF